MSIVLVDTGVRLSNSDAFWLKYEEYREDSCIVYSAIKAFINTVARNVKLMREDFVRHLDGHLGERISKRISEWKVSIPVAIPVSQAMFDYETAPHLENSPRARALSQYLDSLLKDMTYKDITPEQSLFKLSRLNDLIEAFADETERMPESWYRYEYQQPDGGLPKLAPPGYPPTDPRHDPNEDFCLREKRLKYAGIVRQQTANAVEIIFKKMSDLSSPFNPENNCHIVEDATKCVIHFREHWLDHIALCERLMNNQGQDISARIKSLGFHKKLALMV